MQNKMIPEPKKECIASIAMYREMVDRGLDIYDILSQFISFLIIDKKLKQFTAQDINKHLKEIFNYTVPEVAVKEALERINSVSLLTDSYHLNSDVNYDERFLSTKERLEKEADDVFNEIVKFIETKQKKSLSNVEKEKVFEELFYFLLKYEPKNKEYTKLISLWILQNEDNSHIQNVLSMIKEGILVTCAFEYSPNEYKEKTWDTPLTLYYDVENLFSLEGLNGEPYKTLSYDLFNLIKDCNKKNKKQSINLMYFRSIKKEVESFYNGAFEILKRGKKIFQNRTAMANILSGCEDPYDTQEKKVLFFKSLSYKGFEEFDETEYNEEDYKYNIINNDTINNLKEQFQKYDEKELLRVQIVLNKINHLRKNINNSFYKCGHFFVTETGAMLNIALHSDIFRSDMVPLATNIEYLTERIWSKTNSTFGPNKPKSVNAVIMAQLILSSQVNIVINEKYEELKKHYKEEKVNEEEANEILAALKEARNQSQKITTKNAERIVDFIEESIDDELKKQKEIREKMIEKENYIENIEREKDEINQKYEKISFERLEEIENSKKYQTKTEKIKRRIIPYIAGFFILSIMTGLFSRFVNESFTKLIFDILYIVGIVGSIISALIMLIGLRLLEKEKTKDW